MRWDFFIFIFSLLAIMVTDTAFRKSRLGKFVLENILPGTSKNWSYHTDLLVFSVLNLNFHMFASIGTITVT